MDKAAHESFLAQVDATDKATLHSECQAGARAFWHANPGKGLDLMMNADEFRVEVATRLCMAEEGDRWCPLCDAVHDSRAHHARMCCAGGDRVQRHNAVRNFFFRFLATAGLRPELEKPGLLLPSRPDEAGQEARRPADVYVPAWSSGSPAAFDFAVTAPQQALYREAAALEPLAAATAYTSRKKLFMNTAEVCRTQGVEFLPMVVETPGAWAPEATKALKKVAAAAAATTGRTEEQLWQELLQGLAVCVRRSNARAVLRRKADPPSPQAKEREAAMTELEAAAAAR